MGFGTGVETKICDISNSPERIKLIPKVVDKNRPPEKMRTLTKTGTMRCSTQSVFRAGTYIYVNKSPNWTMAM